MLRTNGLAMLAMATCWLPAMAQTDDQLLAHDEHVVDPELLEDTDASITVYEAFNERLGGDSTRTCGGYGCIGWVVDAYPDGAMKHRGYYDKGKLLIYRNYYPNGEVEREFKVSGNLKSVMRTFHDNGQLCAEITYQGDRPVRYVDHYRNGLVRYEEEKHKSGAYYLRMNLHGTTGHPISTMELLDKKKVIFQQREYHPDGSLRLEGRSQFHPGRMDTQRIGDWVHYAPDGSVIRTDRYVDGKIHASDQR
ncbi:MAG: hypothetical protein KDB88_12735 [Flavobacteriales bacterium]|nr:hypothetical protein [Flavobacteriales bacterium]